MLYMISRLGMRNSFEDRLHVTFSKIKKYNIVYADPPWTYNDKALSGSRGAGCKYDLMTLDEICALPVGEITDDNCALFLWVTMPQLPNAFRVIQEWGFTYKTCAFTWVKTNKKAHSIAMGMGNYTRGNAELVLLGTKGKIKRESASVSSVIIAPRDAHSKKPNRVRNKIVELLGDVPRVELFARQRYIGWDSLGFGVEDIDIQNSLRLIVQKNKMDLK